MISNRKFGQVRRVDLEDIARRTARDVSEPPPARQFDVHDLVLRVNPDGTDIKAHPEHVDGGIDIAIASLNQQNTLTQWQNAPEHQAAQLAAERFTEIGQDGRFGGAIQVLNPYDRHMFRQSAWLGNQAEGS
jgi:hypothetical protein